MKPPLRTLPIVLRMLAACTAVLTLAAGAYVLLVESVSAGHTNVARVVAVGVNASLALLVVLWLQALWLIGPITRLVHAIAADDPADPRARLAVYAAPRQAASLIGLAGFAMLAVGFAPSVRAIERLSIAASSGALCSALAAGVLYAAVRYALRPLVEATRGELGDATDLDRHRASFADRTENRVALALAIPATAVALASTLLIGAHIDGIRTDQDNAAREDFNAALAVGAWPGEGESGLSVFVSALHGAGIPVVRTATGYAVPPAPPAVPTLPFAAIPIALVVALLAWQIGKSIGHNASIDLETASRRMSVVAATDIRSVTMSMARPRSIPEIRQMALSLDTLAATLLRMAEDQKRALRARTEASRVRSFVLASGAHDLRGPLNSVLGFGELLLSDAEGPVTETQRESLEALARGGRDLLRLVGDLLDHARIDAGRMVPDKATVALDPILEQAQRAAVERSKTPIVHDQIQIEGEAGLRVVADGEKLARALGALMAFALLRPGGNGRIVVHVRRSGDEVAITIRSGGSTPSREALQRMFEPFDFAPSGARAPAGLNLAVSIARGILHLHGGGVSAEPVDDGGVRLLLNVAAASR